MALPTHVLVTALPDRRTPVDASDGIEPGGAPLHVTDDVICRVRLSQTSLRAINRRDLILCNADGVHVDSVDMAAAPADFVGKVERPKAPPEADTAKMRKPSTEKGAK